MDMEESKDSEVEIIDTSSANNSNKSTSDIVNPEDYEIEKKQQQLQQSQVKSESIDELQENEQEKS